MGLGYTIECIQYTPMPLSIRDGNTHNPPCHDCVHVMTVFVLENKYPFFAKTKLAGNGLLLFLIFTFMSNKINHQYLTHTQTCRGSRFVEELVKTPNNLKTATISHNHPLQQRLRQPANEM